MRFGPRHVALIALAAAVWVAATNWDPVAHRHISDLPVYREAADRLARGDIPYRDFDIEYPPGAVAVIGLVRLIPAPFATAFSLLMFLALVGTILGVMATAQHLQLGVRREVVAGTMVAVTPLLLGDFVATRFDLVVAALLSWSIASAAGRRFRTAWVLLALGVALKLFPVVLAPLLVIWQRRTGSRRLVPDAASGLVVAGACFLPFLVLAPSGLWRMVDYHLARPLQIESSGASYLLGLAALTDRPLTVDTTYGSQNLIGTGPDVIAAIATGLAIAAVVAVAVSLVLVFRRSDDLGAVRAFVAACGATLAALLVTGKVLSPQFLVWLLPATLLVAGRYGRHALVATGGALLVTQLYFPYRYWELVDLEPRPIALLVIRNLLLVVLLAACWPRTDQSAERVNARIAVARPSGAASTTAP